MGDEFTKWEILVPSDTILPSLTSFKPIVPEKGALISVLAIAAFNIWKSDCSVMTVLSALSSNSALVPPPFRSSFSLFALISAKSINAFTLLNCACNSASSSLTRTLPFWTKLPSLINNLLFQAKNNIFCYT